MTFKYCKKCLQMTGFKWQDDPTKLHLKKEGVKIPQILICTNCGRS